MSRILGIDIGSNSLGWAIRDPYLEDDQVVDYGVLTFSEGVGREKGIEYPKVKKRTESRGKRRNYQAEKYRKWELLEFLIHKKMCPLSIEELNKWRKYVKGTQRQYPQSEKFIQWLRYDFDGNNKPDFYLFRKEAGENCYLFRAMAVCENIEHKKIFEQNPYIVGRIFYQLVQRRGFRGRDEEEAKTIIEGSEKTGTKGRDEIKAYIEKYKTLGAALYYYQKENGGRIRQRYNLRKDYETEIKEICKVQDLGEEFEKKVTNAIIWQRPLRTQKGLIGICTYEKNKKRAPVSHPLYEEYRTWNLITNLKIQPPNGMDKEMYLSQKIYPLFYKSTSDFTLETIFKQVHQDGGSVESKFNPKTKVVSAKLLKYFQDLLGKDWKEKYHWNGINERELHPPKKDPEKGYSFEDIWHVLFTFDGQENLYDFAVSKLSLDEEKAKKFSKIKLNQGYASLSLSAIKKILPYLRKGYLYSKAVYMANLYKVLGAGTITEELIKYFAEQTEGIMKKVTEEKELCKIVNRLIQEDMNSLYRYSIDKKRELDESEQKRIKESIVSTTGGETWGKLGEPKQKEYLDWVSHAYKEFLQKPLTQRRDLYIKVPRLHDRIFTFLQEAYEVPEERKKYLWHPSEQDMYANAEEYYQYRIGKKVVYIKESQQELFQHKNPEAEYKGISFPLLGNPEPISRGFKNPMALHSLYQVKHLCNELLKKGKIDSNTSIVIEIARELNDANKRKAYEVWQRQREKENESFKQIIREINQEKGTSYSTEDKVLLQKIRLWTEQNKICLYTGASISVSDVFNGNHFDLEHTIPASISFDNELKNLTLSDTVYNRKVKKKQIPFQLLNYEAAAGGYTAIKPRLKFIEDKVDHWQKQVQEYKNKSSYAMDKEYKDFCIQKKHQAGFELKYWEEKLKTFTLKEYKQGWRNSQLRDTQTATKYALHYLKTVFKKVVVEKAEVVHIFKKIYSIQPELSKKDRSIHAHHAVDAAVLTLIPPAVIRERILERYNEELDNRTGKIYHEKPKDWDKFSESKINHIPYEILINNQEKYTNTLSTYKKIRKRGKLQYVKYQDLQGKWHYKLDVQGNKIPKISQGDTIRGQLHGESFYGAIKQPVRDENNKILFTQEGNMQLHNEIFLVIRKPLEYKKDANASGFKSLEEIERVIVDQGIFQMIKKQVEASDFKTALQEGVWMLDKNGNKVNQIRRIRCKENTKYTTAIKVHTHTYQSKKEYKRKTLAVNGENSIGLLYRGKRHSTLRIITISELSQNKLTKDKEYFEIPEYNHIESGRSKIKQSLPLYAILRSGNKVFFYKERIEELKELHKSEISGRLYKIYQFESDGRIKFRHHLAAGIDTELKKENKEYSYFEEKEKPVFLRLSQAQWKFAVENKDFKMKIDGSLEWLF